MKQSKYFIPTTKQAPSDAQIASHKILLQGGYVKQTAAGIYSMLPLGQKVLQHIKEIVREEIDAIDGAEVFLPVLQPEELWLESERLEDYGPNLMRMKDRNDRGFALGPTHEEVITDIARDHIKSYKKMPLIMYQIQTKFRDELRPRFGLMRGREFMMMDAYSFTSNEADLDRIYEDMASAYRKILTRLAIDFRQVAALSGEIGGTDSSEFQALSAIGEDTIIYSSESDFAANLEVYPDIKEGDVSPDGKGVVKFAKGIEVGHIFKLGTKYSTSMKALFTTKEGTNEPIIMGCYGMGVSRLIMAVLEQHQVEGKVIWPMSVAPFALHMLVANSNNEEQVAIADSIYAALKEGKVAVLYDDRDERLGTKFADADLVGSPLRLVIGKGIIDGVVEFEDRRTNEKTNIKITEIAEHIKAII